MQKLTQLAISVSFWNVTEFFDNTNEANSPVMIFVTRIPNFFVLHITILNTPQIYVLYATRRRFE